MLRVGVADDQALVRSGLVMILDSEDDIEVVCEASNGRHAVDQFRRDRPDLALMDIRMPELDGIEATRELCAIPAHPTRILILTTFDLDEYVFAAMRAGASGFLLKDTPPAELIAAVRVIAAGDALLAPSVTRRLIERYVSDTAELIPAPGLGELTDRETEVLRALARGLSNAEIDRPAPTSARRPSRRTSAGS